MSTTTSIRERIRREHFEKQRRAHLDAIINPKHQGPTVMAYYFQSPNIPVSTAPRFLSRIAEGKAHSTTKLLGALRFIYEDKAIEFAKTHEPLLNEWEIVRR